MSFELLIRLRTLLVFIAVYSAYTGHALALPVDDFSTLSRRTYRFYGDAEESFRGDSSLGSILTVELPYNPKGERLQFGGPGGEGFTVTNTSMTPLLFRLSWDGESAVRVVSGAGLGCIDLTAERASAFILKDFSFTQTCPKGGYECPFVEVQIKVFDGGDPTGQRYSSGVVRRRVIGQKRDLMIPFSQLVREGPEGPWRPSCVGAVTLTVLGVPQVQTTVYLRSLSTNGSCKSPLESGRPSCSEVVGARLRGPLLSNRSENVDAFATPAVQDDLKPENDSLGAGGSQVLEAAQQPQALTPGPTSTPAPEVVVTSTPTPVKRVSEIDSMFDDLSDEVTPEEISETIGASAADDEEEVPSAPEPEELHEKPIKSSRKPKTIGNVTGRR